MIKDLYEYRQLLKSNIRKEVRGKYKGSFLGVLWSFVNPLLMTLVYAIVFPLLLRSSQPHYTTFIVIAIIPWTWFTYTIASGTNTFLVNEGIVKKVYFPREILPISIVTSGLINFLISCIIICLFLLFSGIGFSINIIYLPLIVITQYILQLGIILITSAIDVYIRDAEYIINFFVMMLFYGTPILYSVDMFPEQYRWILRLNPMATIIESYRNIFYYKTTPNFVMLGIVFLFSLLVFGIGTAVFRKLEKGFAEEL
ncbi:MAG: ABC transporter permease [Bacilli bacterium]|nr:ABC transporter permease [Bacilli bacterium]